MTMMRPLPGNVDGRRVEDETGPCNGVKGAVDAYDPPLEARVPRLDRCCLKQKVGYSRDAAPKNNYQEQGPTTFASRVAIAKTRPLPENICCLAGFLGETGDSGHSSSLVGMAFCRGVKNDLLGSVGEGFQNRNQGG